MQRLAAVLCRELLHPGLELGSEVADETLDGPGESLTKSWGTQISMYSGIDPERDRSMTGLKLTADGVALDLLGQLLKHINLALVADALLEAGHDLLGPLAALTAGRALSAGLVSVEVT